ncbi:hypothetical protein [Allokutzneria sp. NRRL B-24872]|uniref:hypothetical protein n=1 Tax=Allokutzneria sp. NRRL B-24872 TaxID=1137961 RepID=UPI000A376A9B|nr:hypothetical protein [Allokutzneria sp. NRRL B-24872]
MTRLAVLVPIAVLGVVLVGAEAARGEPDPPRIEVVESGVIIKADLRGAATETTGTILAQRHTVISATTISATT